MLCEKDHEDCYWCNIGYKLSAPAGNGQQTCISMAKTCNGIADYERQNGPSCTCPKGKSGNLAWSTKTSTWIGSCRDNRCICPNGIATTSKGSNDQTLCAKDKTVDCVSCNNGYYLTDAVQKSKNVLPVRVNGDIGSQMCQPYGGTCENGALIAQSRADHLRIAG